LEVVVEMASYDPFDMKHMLKGACGGGKHIQLISNNMKITCILGTIQAM
jgi:hypothetical protein